METIDMISALTPAHFLMAGLGLQMAALLVMWLAAESMPANPSPALTGWSRDTGSAQVLRVAFPQSRKAPVRRGVSSPELLERNAA
jgi:hypothetical protein